jgi:Plasmid replication region DNA-binding N-term
MVRVEIHRLAWAFLNHITLVRRRIPEITVIITDNKIMSNMYDVWCNILYMPASTEAPNRYGSLSRGISASDVGHAADALLRLGMRPTIEKIRLKIGKGSPNTINPLLDAWWKTLSARLDSGPAALHRLPESVAHVAEALWMQALEEGRRRAHAELKTSERLAADKDQNLEVRSHVLTLREGELDSRLRDRERTIDDLNLRLRELTTMLRKEQATRESLSQQVAELQSARLKKAMPRQQPRPAPRNRKAKALKRSTVKRPKARTRR